MSDTTLIDALDALTVEVGSHVGLPATRDPSAVAGLVAGGGCVWVAYPDTVVATLEGVVVEVAVSVLAPAPASLTSVNLLLAHQQKLADSVGGAITSHSPIDIGDRAYPAVTVAARAVAERISA